MFHGLQALPYLPLSLIDRDKSTLDNAVHPDSPQCCLSLAVSLTFCTVRVPYNSWNLSLTWPEPSLAGQILRRQLWELWSVCLELPLLVLHGLKGYLNVVMWARLIECRHKSEQKKQTWTADRQSRAGRSTLSKAGQTFRAQITLPAWCTGSK